MLRVNVTPLNVPTLTRSASRVPSVGFGMQLLQRNADEGAVRGQDRVRVAMPAGPRARSRAATLDIGPRTGWTRRRRYTGRDATFPPADPGTAHAGRITSLLLRDRQDRGGNENRLHTSPVAAQAILLSHRRILDRISTAEH